MTLNEIKTQIDANNARIEELSTTATFVLNRELSELLKANDELRGQCTHEFAEDGTCRFCYSHRKTHN